MESGGSVRSGDRGGDVYFGRHGGRKQRREAAHRDRREGQPHRRQEHVRADSSDAGTTQSRQGHTQVGGDFTGFITRDGLRIQIGTGTDNLSGGQGSFRVTGQIEHVPIVGGYFVDTGTWRLSAGTGVYVGLSGGGRYAAVVLPSNRILFRAEGFVRKAS